MNRQDFWGLEHDFGLRRGRDQGSSFIQLPPADPKSNYYLKICYVCQERAKPNQEHCQHYGAVVCFSCRAFFRRANQKTKKPVFQCKNGNKCTITVANRRRCQKCRYTKCITAGMSPDAVLTDDQKVIRFRKVLSKRRFFASQSGDDDSSDSSDSSDDEKMDTDCPADISPSLDPLMKEVRHHKAKSLKLDFDDAKPDPAGQLFGKVASPKPESPDIDVFLEKPNAIEIEVEAIHGAYKMANMQMSNSFNDQLIKKMLAIHEGETTVQMKKSEFQSYIIKMSEQFRHFALLQRHFGRLSKSDQLALLSRNTSRYIQFSLGSFLGAQNTGHQVNQMLTNRKNLNLEEIFSLISDNFVDLNQFNEITKLFRPGANLKEYSNYIQKFNSINNITCLKFRAVFAYAILFDIDGTLNLQGKEAIYQEIRNSYKYVKYCSEGGCFQDAKSISGMMKILGKMALFSSYNVSWPTGDPDTFDPLANVQPVMSYTREEEKWFEKQLGLIDEVFRSVTIGDEILNEFFMFSLGVPLSRNYMKGVVSITLERVWRLFNAHPDFEELPSHSQLDMMATNGPVACAAMICRYESRPLGIQQIQEGFGELDEIRWRENYLPTFKDVDKVRRLTMRDAVTDKSVFLSEENLAEYERIIQELKGIASDPQLYKVLLLMSMMKPTVPEKRSPLEELRSTYVTAMQRRQSVIQYKSKEISTIVLELERGLKLIERMSTFLINILNAE